MLSHGPLGLRLQVSSTQRGFKRRKEAGTRLTEETFGLLDFWTFGRLRWKDRRGEDDSCVPEAGPKLSTMWFAAAVVSWYIGSRLSQ